MENAPRNHADTRQNPFLLETISVGEQERFLSILSFWHKLEFFIPFDLEQRLANAGKRQIRYLHRQELDHGRSKLWQVDLPEDEEVKRFNLYLGVFDKSEITKLCNRVLGPSQYANEDEEFERTELEGPTCFVWLKLGPTGELILESIKNSGPVSYVSTLPWALGQFEKAGFASLTSHGFESAKQHLAEMLLNFEATRRSSTAHESAASLTHSEILELHQALQDWAGFSIADDSLIGILEVVTAKKKKKGKAAKKPADAPDSDAAKEELADNIAILNSFFIKDLESVIKSIESGRISRALKKFFSPLPISERVDLQSPSGLRAIVEMLHPARLNRGRWLSDPNLSMALMQQFAINSMLQDSADASSLFSVNGPPGTGKTTLLQDVFADLIVRRARVLAGLNEPSDAFLPQKVRISFKGKQDRRISILKPELTGFEIVVASSNNTAVENISADFPKVKNLGLRWRASEYLKTVAYKVAAQKDDRSFEKLNDTDQPWSLISCVLGKSKNRFRFKERFCYMDALTDRKPSWQTPDPPLQIRHWIDKYCGRDFAAAKREFRKLDEEVEKTCARLKPLADLLTHRLDPQYAERILFARRRVADCESEIASCQQDIGQLAAPIGQLQNSLGNLQEEERLLTRSSPAWWARLRRTSEAKLHGIQVRRNASAQLHVRRELGELKRKRDVELLSRLTSLTKKLESLQAERHLAETENESIDRRFTAAEPEFTGLPLPTKLDDLEAGNFQKSGLWNFEFLAQQRSELFAAALALHEAWLASVGKPKAGFRPNILAIADLLSGLRLENPSHALPVWQSLFLIVPVVSTTFASFQNQFRDLGAASLGWLFIDEAGQAVPQAAAGAIWRANHAVVIGDPLQIEPVFTLPSRFISAVAALSPHTADGRYSPHKTSVQRIADYSSKFGVNIGSESDQGLWVGSPLRVHRRCIDPMFSWSNEIAYEGKMIFGLPSRNEPNGPPIPFESAWIDVKGKVRKRQEVAAQTEFVLELLVALYRRDRRLPGLYLISPFTAIKTELTNRIVNLDWVSDAEEIDPPGKQELEKWCKQRVGTVHTFQGKEEHSVLMILGADPQHAYSADWACAKPNILNVALTRAQRRFYLVGDRELWGVRGPFSWSKIDDLPTTSPRQFLANVQNGSALGKSAAP